MSTTPVNAHMTHAPHTIGRDQTLATARTVMAKHHIRHLPVLDGGHVVGLVSERDLDVVEGLRDVDPKTVTVAEAMSPDPYVVPSNESIVKVAREMARHKYGSAVVVDGAAVVGVFTAVDALKALASSETWAAHYG